MSENDSIFNSGVLTGERPGAVRPPLELWNAKRSGLVVVECPQRIPCNPCFTSCPSGAILPFSDINDTPRIDYEKCTGCAICVAACPGLACFVVDLTFSEDRALYKIPYEMLPLPSKGDTVACLGRSGEVLASGTVESVIEPKRDKTYVLHVSAPKEFKNEMRAIRAGGRT